MQLNFQVRIWVNILRMDKIEIYRKRIKIMLGDDTIWNKNVLATRSMLVPEFLLFLHL